MAKNYEVKIVESKGSCDSTIFEKMAQNGDITSKKVSECIDSVITLTGYAVCHITTSDKEFDMGYYATTTGMISTGSEVFRNSIEEYYGEVDTFQIVSVKTKKGTTYKVTPVLLNNAE